MVPGTARIAHLTHALDASAVMELLPGRPRLLALGEPTHGEDTLLDVRNALFRQLVEREGYRTIAVESDCLAGLRVDAYVTTGAGTLDEAMEHGFSHGFGASAANRELVRWAREYNTGRPAADRLRLAGFDAPLEMTGAASPRRPLTALHAFLTSWLSADGPSDGLLPRTADTLDALLGPDGRWTDPAALTDPSRSCGRSPEAVQLALIAHDLVSLLDERAPQLIAAAGREAWDRARLHGRTATGLLSYHSWLADTTPARMTRLVSVRDRMMAENLLALAERGPVLAFAHNAHLQRERNSMRMGDERLEWWGAGSIVSARLGPAYGFLATALGTIRHQGVDAPPPETVEGLLYALPEDRFLVDAPGLAGALGDPLPAPRVSPWFGYFGLDPAHLRKADGLVFIRDVRS
ncbi:MULTISPECIES: erythromycin esterase family protein [unclassified Streptomyces]|uniref:erythromycin esterase family protein n=1 Tax=unclassified Streptomyces TaxID=2593676 RepID=UPI0008239902|nr:MULTISPECIES: erythromycin esterase family protein [unclassified Streptomyces]MYT97803.1 erythromycin esterase [Streptomyces sp. SID8350]SCK17491.1 Erythromycin esterase homolog [Streptomyces sp. AmelKG-D3]